jgi:hypothetical protein
MVLCVRWASGVCGMRRVCAVHVRSVRLFMWYAGIGNIGLGRFLSKHLALRTWFLSYFGVLI